MSNEKTVLLCDNCGVQFSPDFVGMGDPCPCEQCAGNIKEYRAVGAAIANMLDMMGRTVKHYNFSRETDVSRCIEICFVERNEFPIPPPQGFRFISGWQAAEWILTKSYPHYLPLAEYAEQLARDKVALIIWCKRCMGYITGTF